MEKILIRAIIVLSVIGVLIGGPMFYFGWVGYERYSEALNYEWTLGDSPKLKECRREAIAANDQNQVAACELLLGPDLTAIDMHTSSMVAAQNQQFFGTMLAVVIPLVLFVAYYVLRWIITGRWTDAKAAPKPTS